MQDEKWLIVLLSWKVEMQQHGLCKIDKSKYLNIIENS